MLSTPTSTTTRPHVRRAPVALLVAAAATSFAGCSSLAPQAGRASPPTTPTSTDLESLALAHHDAYGDALVATVDDGMMGVYSTARLEALATSQNATLDASTMLTLLENGQRLVAYADAVDATLWSEALPEFEVLLCVDPNALRYEDLAGSPIELLPDETWPMVMGYEHRPDELPLMVFQALDPSLAVHCT